MERILRGCCVVRGRCEGETVVTSQPISFWGGVDPAAGCVNDRRHELFGQSISGKVLVFPFGKGSSTTSLIILELARVDKAPAGIINLRTEPILATGPIVCKHLYGKEIPIVTLDEEAFQMLRTGQHVVVNANTGEVVVREEGPREILSDG
ncbi:MAG: aconitase X swivel domain-containing protein [Thermodesulfobacteriota bacterium]